MNPGIYYFYEYIHSRRLRNVGFLKFSVRYGKYIIRLSIKGIPVAAQQKVSLSAILSENKSVSSSTIGELTCGNQNISAQFPLPETPSLHESTVGSIVGFFLTLPGGNLIISTIPGITVNADTIAALTRKKYRKTSLILQSRFLPRKYLPMRQRRHLPLRSLPMRRKKLFSLRMEQTQKRSLQQQILTQRPLLM